jgi:hypothetical protein
MNKRLLFLVTGFLFAVTAFCQSSETIEAATQSKSMMDKVNSKSTFKAHNPKEDKTDMLTVTGIGSVSFATSNTSDGTSNSYYHSQRITMPLQVSYVKPVNVSLIFYSSGDKIPYAATSGDEGVNVYYPISLYEEIKQRLEQSLSAKKKVQLKVTQKTDGFREAVLLF